MNAVVFADVPCRQICHVVHVADVRLERDTASDSRFNSSSDTLAAASSDGGAAASSGSSDVTTASAVATAGDGGGCSRASSSTSASASARAGDAATAALTELPTCPVCLERLDGSISGLLTTICNHTFHCTVSDVVC